MSNRLPNLSPNVMLISLLLWNVQGAGSTAFLAALREILRMNNPTVIALVETHMGGDHAELIASKIGFNWHMRVDTEGFSGGIWVYWRSEVTPWYFSAIYASPDPVKRHDLWQHLKDFARTHNHPWLLAGDFNDTRYSWERSACCNEVKRRAQ
ncbi:hypothetical protein RDABS01_029980 [Bienertia sinuspersici]